MFTNTSAKVDVFESTIVISAVARRLLRFATINSVPELALNFGKTYLKLCAVCANMGDAEATTTAQTTKVRKAIEVSLCINVSHVNGRTPACQGRRSITTQLVAVW